MINQLKEMEAVRQRMKREGFESLEYIKDKLEHLNFDDHLGCYVEKNGKPVGLASWVNGAMYSWKEGRNSAPECFVLMPVEPTDEIARVEWDKNKGLFHSTHRGLTAIQVETLEELKSGDCKLPDSVIQSLKEIS